MGETMHMAGSVSDADGYGYEPINKQRRKSKHKLQSDRDETQAKSQGNSVMRMTGLRAWLRNWSLPFVVLVLFLRIAELRIHLHKGSHCGCGCGCGCGYSCARDARHDELEALKSEE